MATIKGKWVFKDDNSIGSPISISSISFNSNNTQYNSIDFNYGGEFGGIMGYYGSTPVYDQLGGTLPKAMWQNEAYRTVDFGDSEQTVSDTFLTWMQANATPEASTDAVTIEYNGAVIASLKAGQSATLPCKDKPMLTDVVVTVPEGMGAGEVVEEWDGSYTVSGGTISFTIDGDHYEAEEGMTWREWWYSDYNTDGYEGFVAGNLGETIGLFDTPMSSRAVAYNNIVVSITDVIVADREYQLKTVTTGGGA